MLQLKKDRLSFTKEETISMIESAIEAVKKNTTTDDEEKKELQKQIAKLDKYCKKLEHDITELKEQTEISSVGIMENSSTILEHTMELKEQDKKITYLYTRIPTKQKTARDKMSHFVGEAVTSNSDIEQEHSAADTFPLEEDHETYEKLKQGKYCMFFLSLEKTSIICYIKKPCICLQIEIYRRSKDTRCNLNTYWPTFNNTRTITVLYAIITKKEKDIQIQKNIVKTIKKTQFQENHSVN